MLIGLNIKEPDKDSINQSVNSEGKDNTNISGTKINKENINKIENISNTSPSLNSLVNFSENNSKIKRYIYKQTLENYTTTVYVKNLSTSDRKKYVIDTIDDISKEKIELKIENNNVYKKVTPLTGEGFERDYQAVDWNNAENINVEGLKDMLYMSDLIFSFDILYFQDLKNIEKINLSGIKNSKLIKTECNNESGMELVCNMGGCNNYTMYNCYSFWNITYNLTYREETNNKKNISKSWTEKYECEIGLTEEQEKEQKNQHSRYCDGFNLHPSFDKIYFAGTENFNGKMAYKIIYERFEPFVAPNTTITEKDAENSSDRSIWHFVDILWIDKEDGILLKATAKNRWISYGVPDEFTPTEEIVLENEY